MRKINVLFIAVGVALMGFMSSCTKDDTDTSFSKPTIAVNLDGQAVSGTVSKAPGTALTFDIKFGMGDQSDKLTNVSISSVIAGKTFSVLDSVLNSGIFNGGATELTYTYRTNVGNVDEKLIISITDKKDRVTTDTILITPTTVTPTGDFVTSEATLLGGQKNADYGSFYSVALGKVLNLSAAKSQSEYVDFVYYYGLNNLATLSSAASSDAQSVFNSTAFPSSYIAGWSTKNTTKYSLVDVDFDNVTVTDFDAAVAGIGSDNQSTQLSEGDVIAFKTSDKSGLIKVNAINTSSTGYITIYIKMKK